MLEGSLTLTPSVPGFSLILDLLVIREQSVTLESRVLHKGAWVATLLGSRTIKRSNFQDEKSRSWQLRG